MLNCGSKTGDLDRIELRTMATIGYRERKEALVESCREELLTSHARARRTFVWACSSSE